MNHINLIKMNHINLIKMNQFVMVLLLVSFYMGTNSVAADDVPLELSIYNANNYPSYDMPDSCAEDNYCFEKGDNYPDDKIAELLKDMRETPVENPQQPINLKFDFESRQGLSPKGNVDCPANTTYTSQPIYYIKDTNDRVRVVIQSPTKFQQIYSVKWCLNPGRITTDTEHFVKNTGILESFNIECVNTFMDFDFFVLNDDYEPKIETVRAKGGIPVYCRCRYSHL